MNRSITKWLLLYPSHLLRKEAVFRHLYAITQLEQTDAAGIEQYQREKLREVINLAFSQGIYGEKHTAKTIPDDTDPEQFLLELPTFSKSDIRTLHTKLGHNRYDRDYRSTSGSTGEPLKFYKGHLATGIMDAVQYRANAWHDIQMGEPQARFWGVPVNRKARNLAKLKDFVKNRIRFSAFSLDSHAKFAFYTRLQSFRPTHFYGYPSLILEFATYMETENLKLSFPLKAIIGTGEHADENTIKKIEHIFRTKYVSEYGCTEAGLIGFDCPRGNMHICAQNVYVEILKDNKRVFDEEGELYVTELNSDYLPFIRYKTGDRAILHKTPCACGLPFSVLQLVSGRIDDYIVTPEGTKVYDAILAYTLTKGIMQFKATQHEIDRLTIQIRPNEELSEDLLGQYRSSLIAAISPSMKIEFEITDNIPRESSGKLRYFRSELNKNDLFDLVDNSGEHER